MLRCKTAGTARQKSFRPLWIWPIRPPRQLDIDNPDPRNSYSNLLAAFQRHLATALAEAQVEGTVRRDVDPGDAAVFLTSLVQGLAIRWTHGARKGSLTREGARLVDVQMAVLAPADRKQPTRLAAAPIRI